MTTLVKAGMKASWVITDEERQERQERNRIKTTSSSSIVNINNNLGGEYAPCSNTSSTSDDSEENDNNNSGSRSAKSQHLLPLLTETELQFIDNLVTKSGFFESSMIADLNVHLARQIVR